MTFNIKNFWEYSQLLCSAGLMLDGKMDFENQIQFFYAFHYRTREKYVWSQLLNNFYMEVTKVQA